MKKWMLAFGSICSLAILISCAPQEEIILNSNEERVFYSCDYEPYGRRAERFYYRESWVELYSVIKDGDTLNLKELNCVDSLKFTQELNQIEVSDICVEMGIQGRTYFIAKTNKYGGFEEVTVPRSLGDCFRDFENKIKEKVLSMRIFPEHAGTYEVVFSHRLIITEKRID